MKKRRIEKWLLILKKARKKLVLYFSVASIIIATIAAFFIYREITNRKAYDKFYLAMLSYQKAGESENAQEKLEEYQKASEIYQEIISKYPLVTNKREIFLYLGNCFSALKNYDEAEKIYIRFIKKYKKDYFIPWVKIIS